MVTVTIVDESTIGDRQSYKLEFLTEIVSLREILRKRIYQEVTAFNASNAKYFHGLIRPDKAQRTLNGYRLLTVREIDWESQFTQAIEAFERNAFLILVNKKQITDLDTPLILGKDAQITFFKLVPLVGG